jgi:hypothetical protein
MDGRQAPSGVAFSLVTFLLATQEKVTRPPQEDESFASAKRYGLPQELNLTPISALFSDIILAIDTRAELH